MSQEPGDAVDAGDDGAGDHHASEFARPADPEEEPDPRAPDRRRAEGSGPFGDGPEQPDSQARGVEPFATGHPAVDEVLRSLSRLDGLPIDDHPLVYDEAHERLREALDDAQRSGGAGTEPDRRPTDQQPTDQRPTDQRPSDAHTAGRGDSRWATTVPRGSQHADDGQQDGRGEGGSG